MYCKYCGKIIQEKAKFCKYCGKPVEEVLTDENTDRNVDSEKIQSSENGDARQEAQREQAEKKFKKKSPLFGGIVALCAVVLIIVASIAIINIQLENKFKNLEVAVMDDNIEECVSELQNIETNWKETGIFAFRDKKNLIQELNDVSEQSTEYIAILESAQEYINENSLESYGIAEDEYKQYQADVEELKQFIAERKAVSVQTAMEKVNEAYNTWMEAGKASIQKKIDEYKNVNLTTAESSDKEIIQNAIEQIGNQLQEKDINFADIEECLKSADEIFLKYVEPENYINIKIQQIDVTEYPRVKLYLDVTDRNNNIIDNLDAGMFYVRKQDANGNYIKQQVKTVNQLNEVEALNINMLADVSGSMMGNPLTEAKSIMNRFINSVQFSAGDLVALTSFSNGVYINQDFTNSASTLKTAVDNLYAQDMTSFYDALYTSVNKVAARTGAKCVIAFTDGMDNNSSCTASDVITLAQRYHVPIFVIGIGNEDYSIARNIAMQTGGSYFSAVNVSDMSYIYNQIYKQEKEMYMLEFEDTSDVSVFKQSSIVTGYHTLEYGGETNYSYTPNTLVSVDNNSIYKDGPEGVVASYMVAFADAMTNQSYSYIEPYILSGSALESEQKNYVVRGISEVIDSYEIENVEYTDASNCIVTTRETYFVQKTNSPLALLTQRCKYNVVKYGNDWKMTGFAGKVEVLSRIHY